MFDVSIRHPRYLAYATAWREMRDAISGEDDVKAGGESYLPMKSGMLSIEDRARRAAVYDSYRLRAEFPEIVAPTITGQVGLMNAQPPTVELPPQLETMRERATIDGMTLDELVSHVSAEILAVGRFGLLPSFAEGRPYIACYPAESITNWDKSEAGELDYVTLDETKLVRNRLTNAWERLVQYREIGFEDGRVRTRIWRSAAGTELVMLEAPDPLTASTVPEPIDFLPFVPMGTRSLSIDPEDVPLWGLAKIAYRMYRLDADYMQGLHMTSEPTPWVNGFDDPVQAVADGKVPSTIGAAALWVLRTGAQCGFLEFSGPGLDAQRKALDASREAAATFGARMFDETNRSPESGESRKVRYGQETSQLKTIAKVACSGVERALRLQARWLGLDENKVSVTPNLDWVTDAMSPTEITAIVKAWMDGAISYETLFQRMQAGKVVASDRTMEDEIDAILNDELRNGAEESVDQNGPESGLLPQQTGQAFPPAA